MPAFTAHSQPAATRTLAGPADTITGCETSDRILIIDDDANVLEMLRLILHRYGYGGTYCRSAQAGLDILASGREIDVVIVDWVMPEISGPDFIEQAARLNPRLRFIITSGAYLNFSLLPEQVNQDTVLAILGKPFNIKELMESIAAGLRLTT